MLLAALAAGGLVGCAGEAAPAARAAPVTPPPSDPRALAADLNARLEALQHQSEPASDETIAALERTLREQREKRARAVVAAGSTSAVPSYGPLGAPAQALPGPPPSTVAAAPAPAQAPSRPLKGKAARLAAAKAAREKQAAAARPSPASTDGTLPAAAGPSTRPAEIVVPAPPLARSTAATVTGPAHTPMARMPESRVPVDQLYERARAMEVQLQVPQAVDLYREASQRGHAPSSRRLMELYADGAPGVARDYRVAVFFKERAIQQGATFEPTWRR
jgi:hypothetical protein